MLPDVMPLNRAPILQPKASLAPYPIKKPPIIAAYNNFLFIEAWFTKFPAKADAIKAPKIIPKLETVVGSASKLFSKAIAG